MYQSFKQKISNLKILLLLLLAFIVILSIPLNFVGRPHAAEIENSSAQTADPTTTTTHMEPTTTTTPTEPTQPETEPSQTSAPTSNPDDHSTDNPPSTQTGIPYLLVGENLIIKGKVGEKIQLVLPLVNIGTATAVNITASPQLAVRDEEFPFEIEKSEYISTMKGNLEPVQSLDKIKQATKTIDFGQFKIRESLNSGYYRVSFKINYRTLNSNTAEQIERYFFIKVENPNQHAGQMEEPPLNPDNSFDPGSFPEIGGSGEEIKTTPRLLIAGFTTDPEKLLGGKNFTLNLKLKNTSKDSDIRNIKLTFSSEGEKGPVFLPVDGASTMFIEKIAKDTEQQVSIQLKSNSSVEQKIYPLNLKFEYEDLKGNAYTAEEMVSLMVYQELRCDIGKIEIMPNPVMLNNEANIMFSIFNKGKSTLNNVSIVIPEGGALESNEIFIGNIEAGTSKDVDFMVKAIAVSEEPSIPFEITFEDAEGSTNTIKQNIDLMIAPEEMDNDIDLGIDDPGMMEDPTESPRKVPFWVWLIVAAVIIVLLIIMIKVLKKRKQKKEQAEIDEMV